MNVSEKVLTKRFAGETKKDAFLKACKWLAVVVIANDEISKDMTYSISRDGDYPAVVLELFVTMSDTEHTNQFCKSCSEFHSLFYINQQQNCNNCNMKAYRSQSDEKIRSKKSYKRKLLGEKVLL